ncbi:hypothetical protein UlMin_003589 [Ulmus minor]
MADYEPPSFSLGLDLDFEPPSFSLGIDLDFHSEPQLAAGESSVREPAPEPPIDSGASIPQDDEEKFEAEVADSDLESGPDPTPALKRLRRGLPRLRERSPARLNGDDDIEEFSSEEGFVIEVPPSTQYHSMCSSSKIPLHGSGAIKTQSFSKLKLKNKTGSVATASSSKEPSQSAKVFPNVTISPLRRFQIIDSDSDSDDPSTSVDIKRKDPIIDQSSKKQQSNPGHSVAATEKMRKALDGMTRKADLWKDFSPVKSFHLPTPALDEVCEEYFRSVKNTNSAETVGRDSCVKSSSGFDRTTNGQNMEQVWTLDDPLPPSHLYFFSDDQRIRMLVCNRLPNFFPLGVTENRGNQQNCASAIDYMGQFGEPCKRQTTQQVHLERSSKRGRNNSNSGQVLFDSPSSMNPGKGNATGRSNAKKSSSKGREKLNVDASGSWVDPKQGKGIQKSGAKKTSRTKSNASLKSNGGEALHDSGNWMDPRSSGSITNESGRKRVQANAQSARHWFTGSDGRKVYVNKKGQELTGQIAYRQYKKENGSGFRRGKKKTSSKKKG